MTRLPIGFIFGVVCGIVLTGTLATLTAEPLNLTVTDNTFMKAGGKSASGLWLPLNVDEHGNVICAVPQEK